MQGAVKILFIYSLLFLFLGCESLSIEERVIGVEEFDRVKLGYSSRVEIENKFGKPEEKTEKQWVYHSAGVEKLWIDFSGSVAISVSMSIWESDEINSPKVLVGKIQGDWKVLKEPMSNPHAAPSLCYLEDLRKGRRIEVSGYSKRAKFISKWKPSRDDKSIKEFLYRNVGKEFCIGSSCSKVTDPDAWKHNHCEWLVKLVAKIKASSVKNSK